MYQSIVVAFDIAHIDRCTDIMMKAQELRAENSKLRLIYVVEDIPTYMDYQIPLDVIDSSIEAVRCQLRELINKHKLEAEIVIRRGRPHHEIREFADQVGADLIVVASHNPGLQDFFIGSTAGKIVRNAQCSVLVDRT